jgi:excisionase family DNA binding protein
MQEAITLSIPDAASTLGIGRTSLYGLLRAGELETVQIGGRRVVVADSIRNYVDRLRDEQNRRSA